MHGSENFAEQNLANTRTSAAQFFSRERWDQSSTFAQKKKKKTDNFRHLCVVVRNIKKVSFVLAMEDDKKNMSRFAPRPILSRLTRSKYQPH